MVLKSMKKGNSLVGCGCFLCTFSCYILILNNCPKLITSKFPCEQCELLKGTSKHKWQIFPFTSVLLSLCASFCCMFYFHLNNTFPQRNAIYVMSSMLLLFLLFMPFVTVSLLSPCYLSDYMEQRPS